jgi:hypothetical protein
MADSNVRVQSQGSGTADFRFGGKRVSSASQPPLRQIRNLRCLTPSGADDREPYAGTRPLLTMNDELDPPRGSFPAIEDTGKDTE